MSKTKLTNVLQPIGAEAIGKVMSASGEVVYQLDIAQQTFQWFGNLHALFGPHEPSQVRSAQEFLRHVAEEDRQHRIEALHRHLLDKAPYSCRYRFHRFDGVCEWLDETGFADIDDQGEPLAIFGKLKFVTSEELRRQDLEHRARCDELTGLLNRQALKQAAGEILRNAAANNMQTGILLVEINKLGTINHSYGSDVGDQVISWFANQLVSQLSDGALLGRIDSDKSAMVLPKTNKIRQRNTAETLLRIAADEPIATDAGPVRASLTIGGIMAPDEAGDFVTALGRAEEALEDSKHSSRSNYIEFKMQRRGQRAGRHSLAIADDVLQAMNQDRIELAFQPIVDANTGLPQHFECLVRLRQKDQRIVPPGMFLPAMELSGHIRGLDAFVLNKAIEVLRDFPTASLAVNISGRTVGELDAVSGLIEQLEAADDVCDRLTLEITETAAIDDMKLSARFANTVRSVGCNVALDDFGSGYTSFQQLKFLNVDMVKIDAEFVAGITKSNKSRQLITAMVNTCQAFDFEVVAEGVTSAEEANLLAAMGVDLLQGYYFGRPEFGALEKFSNTKASDARLALADANII